MLAHKQENRYLSPNPTLNLTQTVILALTLTLIWASIPLLVALFKQFFLLVR